MKARIHLYISHKYVIIGILIISCILSFIFPAVPFFAGLGFALIAIWSSNWQWGAFGMRIPCLWQTALRGFAYSMILFVSIEFVITPIIELFFGKASYESFDRLRGNLSSTLLFITFIWFVATIGEEFVFRGYYMKHMAKVLGHTRSAWIAAAILSSIIFALAHQYQGVSGVIRMGIVGLALSYFFYHNRQNLLLIMFIHGFYNTIWIILIYLNSERVITDYILNL